MNDRVATDPAIEALRSARSLIAARMLSGAEEEPPLGDVVLRPDQWRAVTRVRALLARHRGALLAEEVGVGKTYVAAAVARRYERVLVVAPASLRVVWERALQRTSVRAHIDSIERLGRARPMDQRRDVDLVIVDEAHHLRTPGTRRYAAIAALCDRSNALLMTATPVQNRREDLAAQLALFLGDAAWSMNDDELARFIVRRRADGGGGQLPVLDGPHWIRIPHEDDLLEAIVALPPPLPGSDEGDGGALVTYCLLRQWASSRAALVEALRRRITRATAMRAALESGCWPRRRELAAWSYADGAVQLALPELLSMPATASNVAIMHAAVSTHETALVHLLALVRRRDDPDDARVLALRALRARHRGARIIAFSEYRETVRALARRLLPDGGVAELTARSARVAGGRVTRQEVLAQLAPRAVAIPVAERIEMLITTDVLSEGLDLQGASVVVHLDLPWNPARLEQRVGRVRRIGSPHGIVSTYVLAPPASAERLLRVEQRLRRKLQIAGGIVGRGVAVLPALVSETADRPASPAPGAAEAASETLSCLACWLEPSMRPEAVSFADESLSAFALAAVYAPAPGFLALLDEDCGPLLVADVGDGPTLDASSVATAVRSLANAACATDERETTEAIARLTAWWDERRGRKSVGLHTPAGARLRARLSARMDALLAGAARHERARIAPLVSRARLALRAPLAASSERALAVRARAHLVDEEWLRGIIAILSSRGTVQNDNGAAIPRRPLSPQAAASIPLAAIILLRRAPS